MDFRTVSHEDADHAARIRRTKPESSAPVKDSGAGPAVLRQLQRSAGNRAVSQLLRGAGAVPSVAGIQRHLAAEGIARYVQREGDDEELQMKRDSAATLQREGEDEELQMKRETSNTLQREGDDEELQMKRDPAGTLQREGDDEELQMKRDPAALLQREADDEELQMKRDPAGTLQREGDDEELQMKPEVGAEGGTISSGLANRISAVRGSGAGLDDGTRGNMEQAFGTSFSDVRIHTSSESDTLNRSVSALAFTTGNDIFFRQGVYQPGSTEGNQLLAHELTHVVQQRTMPSSGGGMHVGPAGDSYEQEADARGAHVASAIERKTDEQSAN